MATTQKQEPQIETVTMEDSTPDRPHIVEFAGKRKLLKSASITEDGQVQVRLDFRNGATRLFTVPANLMAKFAAHGAEQKLGDEIAGLDDVEDCVIAIDELIDRLYNGDWTQRKETNGLAGTSVLVKALVEVYGKTVEQIKTFLVGKTHAEKVALRNNPKIKPTIEKIESEKANKGSKVNTDALLGELDDLAI